MIAAVLAFIGLGMAFVGAFQKAAAVDMKINELLHDLDFAKNGLQMQLMAADKERNREISQAKTDLEIERRRILAEEADLVSDLETDIRQRQEQHEISDDEADRQVEALKANAAAAIKQVGIEQEQLKASLALTTENLRDRMAAGDIEAERKAKQILANRDQFLANTKDSAILALNAEGEQLETALGRAEENKALQIGQAEAKVAASAVRRSGTPLLAIRQIERAAKEEAAAESTQGRAGIQSTALGVKQKQVGAREEAEQNTDDVMAQQALSTQELTDQVERAELDFASTYANLEASKADIARNAEQDVAAAEAEDRAEDLDYTQDVERLKDDAADAKRGLENDLTAAIQSTKQRTADINAQTDVLTAEYRRNLTELSRKKSDLEKNRLGIVAGAAFGASSDILNSAQTFFDSLPVVA